MPLTRRGQAATYRNSIASKAPDVDFDAVRLTQSSSEHSHAMTSPSAPYVSSDNPNLIPPSGPNWRLIGAVIAALCIIGATISIPAYEAWQSAESAHAERGKMNGAVYTVEVDGEPVKIELGWAGNHLALLADPELPPGAVVTVKGDFGPETLPWNAEYQFFGPTQAEMNPFSHHKVSIRIENDGQLLWSGKRWAWGVPTGHHHH
ncbi:hypothetical protein H5P28_05340 [Ruficoccus amylovorans]|uniref:Uncharacterized protein n=1 Tax=Ruficoccus amylovorans TaxID=1804625 RepID=A0A842HEC0_9BACT|nr:hypothetical protein [Ruficoccus amylovorans]MBC2593681.1 hypothetical protein [Ruficoccus amylovorans]